MHHKPFIETQLQRSNLPSEEAICLVKEPSRWEHRRVSKSLQRSPVIFVHSKEANSSSHLLSGSGLLALTLLWEEEWVNIWKDSWLNDSRVYHQLVELLIITDSELDVAWSNSLLFVLLTAVSSELKDFTGNILEDSGHKDSSSHTNLVWVASLFDIASGSSNWECDSSSGWSSLWCSSSAHSFLSCHFV